MIANGNTYCRVITPILPPEYQEVEYIESDGTQYIDTGFVPNQNTEFEVEYELNKQGTYGIIFGGEQAYSNNAFHMYVSGSPKKWDIGFGRFYTYSIEVEFNKKIKYKINKTSYYFDNVEYTYISNPTFDNARAVYLFADNRSSVLLDVNAQKKIYKCSIKDNNTLVRNFIPCYRKSDNEIGMYDTVNKVFYTNQGTGTFLKGNNVVHTIRYKIPTEEGPYISGHVTDGSSSLTFKINKQNVTVNIDSNGNWKWYSNNDVRNLELAFYGVNQNFIDKIVFYKIDLSKNINSYYMALGQSGSPISTYRIVDMSKCKGSISISANHLFYRVKTFWYMPNIDYNISNTTLQSQSDFLACGYIKANIDFGNLVNPSKDGIISIINKAEANITFKLHATPYAKCASGGMWYSDVQAAIDAKAQQGYTVTLISA